MALGLCVWNVCNMLVGWSAGFFGILGATKATVSYPMLNMAGAAFACGACFMYMQIKPTVVQPSSGDQDSEEENSPTAQQQHRVWIAKMSGSGRLELVMLNQNHAKICVAWLLNAVHF